jgi:hypothetical protein
VNLWRRKTKVGMKPAYMQLVGMIGVSQSIRRTFGWAIRLMFTRIRRHTLPPQTTVPMRTNESDAVAPHGPVEVTIHTRPLQPVAAALS